MYYPILHPSVFIKGKYMSQITVLLNKPWHYNLAVCPICAELLCAYPAE